MCGIAGYLGERNLTLATINSCLALMKRRGPDDKGFNTRTTLAGKHLYLLHTRLSIIDHNQRSQQPFLNGEDILCYNGEVYNYLEVRSRLAARGETFQTASDTEVLSKLLARDGIQGISAFEGMWAFAWFDATNDDLYICRDRFGEKPLYFYEGSDGVYFGSEPKFIFALLGRKLPINQTQLKRYLVNGYKALYKSDATFFEGLRELSPGHYRAYGAQKEKEGAFWRPVFDVQDESLTYSDAVACTRDALISSVELRLRADVPIAFCLSGGVDSNALISIAKRELGYDVHGFTVSNTDARYEERDMVQTAVHALGLNHTEVSLSTKNFLEELRALIRCHDAPIYTLTYFAQWRLMEAINEAGYKVSISGTGADELFSGYFDHHNAYFAVMYNSDKARYREAITEWRAEVAPIVRNPFLRDPDYLLNNESARDHIYFDADAFSKLLCEPFFEPFDEGFYTDNLLRNRMANELLHEIVPVILHEDDLNAMYYSIENRSPFLDSGLFNVAQSIPTRHLIQGGRAKAVLRDAVRGLVPDAIIDNPRKVGFNVPLFDLLDVNDPKVREEILCVSPIYNIVQRDQIELLMKEKNLTNSRSKFLFNFICAKIFIEENL